MTPEVFYEGMARLGTLFSTALNDNRARIYYENLMEFSDTAFELAVKELIRTCERFPTLARTIEACEKAQAEIYKSKREQEKAMSYHDLERTYQGDETAQRAGREYLSLIKDILNKKLPREVWEARLKGLQEKYGGAGIGSP